MEMTNHPSKKEEILLNIAVLGKSGCGKSTFVNSLCGFPNGDRRAAKTDVIECTKHPEAYEKLHHYDTNYRVLLWDLPGFGTKEYPEQTYIEKTKLCNFDFFMLLSCTRVVEFEITLHNEIAKLGKMYFYVRTKIDRDIANDKRSHPKTFSVDTVEQSIRNDIKRHINEEPNIFLVDAKNPDLYDFPQIEALIESYAASSKRDHAKFALPQVTQAEPRKRCVIS